MKFKMIALGAMLSIPFVGHAMKSKPVEMPAEGVLRERLGELGLGTFMENSNIVALFAEKRLIPIGVSMVLDLACANFRNYLKEEGQEFASITMDEVVDKKHTIFEALLKDHPEALEELKRRGRYKPIEKD